MAKALAKDYAQGLGFPPLDGQTVDGQPQPAAGSASADTGPIFAPTDPVVNPSSNPWENSPALPTTITPSVSGATPPSSSAFGDLFSSVGNGISSFFSSLTKGLVIGGAIGGLVSLLFLAAILFILFTLAKNTKIKGPIIPI